MAGVFLDNHAPLNRPERIVTLGHYYPQTRVHAAKEGIETRVRETRAGYGTDEAARMQAGVAWTRLINALNRGRRWPLRQLFERLNPMLAPDIALAAVPPHAAFHAHWPVRTLAQELAAEGERIDATACLVRHTAIRRIIFGGPSTRALHRQTIQLERRELIQGRRVLLLDDIAKSGASLMACRELLLEAGASTVQALALGRTVRPVE